ncbi:MAG TPA: tRNA (adenine(22)-N(1))-methyltransferase TrmK [Bacillota bacterium]|nr:tRNA (adenine(22)-N(1))-methyltransferase TrmK [Bacillota bacterium]
MISISKRLESIADLVKNGSRVADIGSDHAILPVFLIQSGKAVSAIAGEVNKGPWQAASNQVRAVGLINKIEVRMGDGLSVLKPGEVDTVCIAGMGGTLICSILTDGEEQLKGVENLILQPNVAERNVREWLYHHGWELKGEKILEEDGLIYEILFAERGNPDLPYVGERWTREQWFEIGPYLWEEKGTVYRKKWQAEQEKINRALKGLERSISDEANIKRQSLQNRLKWVEEVIECFPKDKR